MYFCGLKGLVARLPPFLRQRHSDQAPARGGGLGVGKICKHRVAVSAAIDSELRETNEKLI